MRGEPYGSVQVRLAWDPLVKALRTELQEFGGLIRLLNAEQDSIFANPAAAAGAPETIDRQLGLANAASRHRAELMMVQGGARDGRRIPAQQLVTLAPEEIRPLLNALFSEVEKLAVRAEDRSNQNDWLRRRAPLLAATIAGREAAGS